MARSGPARALQRWMVMWIIIALALLAGWVVLNVAWDVASFAVHALLLLAALAVVAHFVRGRFGRGSAAGA